MTTYLWYSKEAESRAADGPQPAPSDSFNGKSRRDCGYCIYLTSDGQPVKVTMVSDKVQHGSGWKDIKLVGRGNNLQCLSFGDGTMSPQGRDFCTKNGLDATIPALLKYIAQHPPVALPEQMVVRRPLTFKKNPET